MTWSPNLVRGNGPLYRAIADALAADIAAGRVQGGERLPTQRDLARSLGVDLTTVTRAYTEAAEGGLIVSEGRRGSFVRTGPQEGTGTAEAATGMNMPPEPEGGLLRRRITDGMRVLLAEPRAPLHYQPGAGTDAQRASAARFLAATIPGTSADQVLLTSGSQHALHAILSTLLRPGDRIAAGQFTYPGFLALARRLGAEIVPLEMDEDGIVPDAFARATASPLRAVYVVPTNDNPTTATLPPARREAIAAIAARHDVTLIEDDAYGRFPADPPAPIAALAPERTWHIASLSKLISPALRVGFVRAPSAREARGVAALLHESAIMAPPLNAALVARWLDDGSFARLLAAVRAEAAARMAAAKEILGPLGAHGQAEGYHLWLPLVGEADAGVIAARAIAQGLPAVASSAFAADARDPVPALRISLGGPAPRAPLLRALRRLEATLGGAGEGAGIV